MTTNVNIGIDNSVDSGVATRKPGQEGIEPPKSMPRALPFGLVKRIKHIAHRIAAKRVPPDEMAVEVCRVDRILETVAWHLPPSPANLVGALGNLAGVLKTTGNLALAELIAVRMLMFDCDQTGALRWQEFRIAVMADIWAGLGKLDDAKEAYRYAAMLAQKRLRTEAQVFVLLNRWAEIAMDAKDYESAAVAYDRAMQMKDVNLNILIMVNGIKDIVQKEALFKMGYLPLKKRIRTSVEMEYDRVAARRRREERAGDAS